MAVTHLLFWQGAAEKSGDGAWRVNSWVKQGILLGFRLGELTEMGRASCRERV